MHIMQTNKELQMEGTFTAPTKALPLRVEEPTRLAGDFTPNPYGQLSTIDI